MVPEISHRCPSCGAAVRDRDALFCPECGKAMSESPTEPKSSEPSDLLSSSSPKPETDHPVAASDSLANEPPQLTQPITETAAATVNPKDEEPRTAIHRRGEKTRERLHRASEVARGVGRGVIEEPAKRVEKIRQASTVVIEEASYDPSLRFVLVALALFVVFVILLVLSKIMG